MGQEPNVTRRFCSQLSEPAYKDADDISEMDPSFNKSKLDKAVGVISACWDKSRSAAVFSTYRQLRLVKFLHQITYAWLYLR